MGKARNPEHAEEGNGYNSFTRPIALIHKFYISGSINAPEEYCAMVEEIRTAPKADVVYLHINSSGGDAFSAIQIMRAMYETEATTIASVEGQCASAATMIFLAAQHHEITRHSMFMVHNYSTMLAGKGGEIYDDAMYGKVWSEGMLHDIYKDFLSEKEIESVLNGKNLYLIGEDVNSRLKARSGKMQAAHKKMVKETKIEEQVMPEPAKKMVKRKFPAS